MSRARIIVAAAFLLSACMSVSAAHVAKRTALRAANKPEAEMNALFRQERNAVQGMFSKAPNHSAIGAFEGANYQASGYYRSEMQCVMFSRIDQYCHVCQDAITEIIDLYSRPAAK
jgi:hypothetical protein